MPLKATVLLLTVRCLLYVEECTCFPDGLVAPSCESMMPQHELYTPSTSSPPYTVSTSSATYRPGQVITVTVEVVINSTDFEGFLLQARSRVGNDVMWPLGRFININTTQFTALNCRNIENSSVSHATSAEKKKVQLTWEAPSNSNYGDIFFSATLVQNFRTFWVQLNSSSLKLESSGNSAAGVSSFSSTLLFIIVPSMAQYY